MVSIDAMGCQKNHRPGRTNHPTRHADVQRRVDTAVAHERLTVWAIENGQHWVLDVQFGEDTHQARQKHFAENLALIRRMALNVIHHNGPSKDSLRCRKPRSSLNDDYRARLIFGPQFT
ncbi:MAG: transposase [Candidatus Competibacter sp.]|nr:transposase [Candidatus Competibacter sp.]